MRNWLAISLLFSLIGCSTPSIAPRFTQPSTVPIQKANAEIQKANASTRTHIQKAQDIVKTIHLSLPEDQAKIDSLTQELVSANQSVLDSDNARASAEGARSSLDIQLKQVTTQANNLARDYDKAAVQIAALNESRHGWVKRFWITAALLAAALIWIFKTPIFDLIKLLPLGL